MSTERYDIKGKIGEGGVGAVYHAYDTHLNRDVAIKRVLADGGYEDQEEATKSLLKEATALSSVQHPHIVTVYDAGVDDDGPYVVMELIHGRTLDEMVERATMTWDDLREVALQSQEALIAAQDLDLVHRDLKPSNIMVCWLPSGKFQVKIVDFGLAKFSAAPSLQTIAHGDAVFGSIFFMAPEQFERIPLDKCTDMYSMGCLYYYALTGEYPFNGETAAMVMASHLQHHVTPLHELRPDIPKWGADWIMWHMEREMKNRPQDAREALGRFLLLDQQSTQPVTVSADNPAGAAAPQLIFPTAATGTVPTQPNPATGTQAVNPMTATQTITPPNSALNVHTSAQPAQPGTAPQFATGPQLTQINTGPQLTQPEEFQQGDPSQIQEEGFIAPTVVKKGLPPVAKWTIIGLLALVIIVGGFVMSSILGEKNQIKRYNAIMAETKVLYDKGELKKGYKMSEEDLEIILERASSKEAEKKRPLQRATLAFAVGDGFDADAEIVKYITTTDMDSNIRADLFKYVMTQRKNSENIPPLLKFALDTENSNAATQAILAAKASCQGSGAEVYLDDFLSLVKNTESDSIRAAAEKAAAEIISNSSNKEKFATVITNSYQSTIEEAPKYSLLRLMASAGGDESAKIIQQALESNDLPMQSAAIAALGKWADDKQFSTLVDYISEAESSSLRKKAFDAAYGFLHIDRERDPDDLGDLWSTLAETAQSQREKLQIVRGVAYAEHKWAILILDTLIADKDDKVIDKAEQAKYKVERSIRNKK